MISLTSAQRNIFRKVVLGACFICSVVAVTRIALQLGEVANPTTVGFGFLILVVASAIFAGLAVAIITSVVATLLFNYFFFPPIGTFVIADFHNWVALVAFLFTSIVISRLTASAHQNARKVEALDLTLAQLKQFGSWLLTLPRELVTLTGVVQGALRIFHLEYCSIHVYAEGNWHHFSGTSVGTLSQQVADSLKITEDHPTGILELAEEQGLGVRYTNIRTGAESLALLVVKSESLTSEVIEVIASMIGVLLSETLRDTHVRARTEGNSNV